MSDTEYDIISRATDAAGRIVIPPHLAQYEFDSEDEAEAVLIDLSASRTEIIWTEASIIAAAILQAISRRTTNAERREVTARMLKRYAYHFGDIHPETARKRLKCGYYYPPTTTTGELVRVPDKPITLYENALVALRYDDDPVAWVLWAIDNDIPAHKIRQYIEAAHAEGPAYIITRPLLFDASLPIDDLRVPYVDEKLRRALTAFATNPTLANVSDPNVRAAATIAAHVADAVYLALAGGSLDRHGDLTAFTVRVLAECERAAERTGMPAAENAAKREKEAAR